MGLGPTPLPLPLDGEAPAIARCNGPPGRCTRSSAGWISRFPAPRSSRSRPAPPCPAWRCWAPTTWGSSPRCSCSPATRCCAASRSSRTRRLPGVRHTAPAAGRVEAIHRGDKRAFVSLVIEVARDDGPRRRSPFAGWNGAPPAEGDGAALRALLLESGLWTRLPHAALQPRARARRACPRRSSSPPWIRAPSRPASEVALAGREEDYAARHPRPARPHPRHRLRLPRSRLAASRAAAPSASRSRNSPGRTRPATPARTSTSCTPRATAAASGTWAHRTSPPSGTCSRPASSTSRASSPWPAPASRARGSCARAWAPRSPSSRPASSPPASSAWSPAPSSTAATAMGEAEGFLGRYHQQVSALPEGRGRELLRLDRAGRRTSSAWPNVVLGAFARGRRRAFTTTTNGSHRAMVPIGTHEAVMPLDILPTLPAARAALRRPRARRGAGRAGARRGGPRPLHLRRPGQERLRAAASRHAAPAREGSVT